MSWVSYLFPITVARFSSPYNREIRINEEKGKYKLLVNGSSQSGEYIKKLWQHALSSFRIYPSPDVRKILVLGVAGGTVIHLLRGLYPDATIEGVDVDSRMIEIGKKYFSLGRFNGLTLIESDANVFITSAVEKKNHWDMVVVDLYVGASIPAFVGEEQFLENVRKVLTRNGAVLINYLREYEYEKLSDILLAKLERIFHSVRDAKIKFNRFFYCR